MVLYDVFIWVDKFIFLVYFMILDYQIDHKIPIILERPFHDTRRALLNMKCEEIKFWVNGKEVIFNLFKSMKQPRNVQVVLTIDVTVGEIDDTMEDKIIHNPLVGVLWNYGSEEINNSNEVVSFL